MFRGTPRVQPTVVPEGKTETKPAIIDVVRTNPQELPPRIRDAVRLDELHPTWLPLTKLVTADNGGA